MTVSTEIDSEQYIGNGITVVFPYRFRILQASDMVVTRIDLNDVETVLVLGTDYNITGAGGYSGGNVILHIPLESGFGLALVRELPVTQETDLRNQGTFFAEVHEDAFDKLTMLIQQCFGWTRLALTKPSIIANYYDALNNRIRNLRDPSQLQDAATKKYVDELSFSGLNKTFRTPDNIRQLPDALSRRNKIVGCDFEGQPVMLLPESGSAADVLLLLASPDGYTYIPSVQIQRWRDEGDIRGWGAVNGGFNDAAIASAYASGSPTIKLGGVGFVSKIVNTIVHQSNKTLREGKVIPVSPAPVILQDKKAILLPDISNASVIDVEVAGTTDGGNTDGGIVGYGGRNITIDCCYVHDIGLSQVSGESGFGFWWGDYANYRPTFGLTIKNCRAENIGGSAIMRGDGILVYNATNVKIHDNFVNATNRMGISIGSDVFGFKLYNNNINDTILASIDIEPDATYSTSGGLVYNNTCSNFASRYSTDTGGAGQTFGIDVHSNTSYIKVFKNTMSAGAYATQIFHTGNHADEIEITDNDVIGGAVVVPLFIKTFDGSGSNHLTISRNRAVSTCKSFAQIFSTTNIDISDNTFSGNGTSGSYFISANTIDGLLIRGNKVSNVDNFITCTAGDFKNGSIVDNIASTLSIPINMNAYGGAISLLTISSNRLLQPLSLPGINIEISTGGSVSSLNVRGNTIPNGTTKIYISPSATGWDTLTRNSRSDLTQAYAGMQLFELASNKNIQYLNGGWLD